MKMKVITRLQNITYLQTLLERALAGDSSTLGSHNLPVMIFTVNFTKNLEIMGFVCSTCVSGTPGYVPPVANFDGESTDGILFTSTAPVNKAKKGNHAKEKLLSSTLMRPNSSEAYMIV